MWSTDRRSYNDTKANTFIFLSRYYIHFYFHGLLFCHPYSRLLCVFISCFDTWQVDVPKAHGYWQQQSFFTNFYESHMARSQLHTAEFCHTWKAKWQIWSQLTVWHSGRLFTFISRLRGHRSSYNWSLYLYVLIYVVKYAISVTCLLVTWTKNCLCNLQHGFVISKSLV